MNPRYPTKSEMEAELLKWRQRAGTVIQAIRGDLDISQTEFGKRLGVSRDNIAAIEQGRGKIELGQFIRTSRVLGLDPRELFNLVLSWPSAKHTAKRLKRLKRGAGEK